MNAQARLVLNMADVRAAIQADDEISVTLARELLSAIDTVFHTIGRSLSEVRADPVDLRLLLEKVPWQATPYSKRVWANKISLLKRAMRFAGINVDRERRRHDTSPAWRAVLDGLPSRHRKALAPLAGWCSAMGIEPDAFEVGDCERWRRHRVEVSVRTDLRESYLSTRRAVNVWLKQDHPERPLIPLDGPLRFRSRDRSAFPPEFFREIEDWSVWAGHVDDDDEDEDEIDDAGPRKALKAGTIKNYADEFRRIGSRLADDGEEIGQFEHLSALLVETRVRKLRRILKDAVGDGGAGDRSTRAAGEKADNRSSMAFHALCSLARWLEATRRGEIDAPITAGIRYVRKIAKKLSKRPRGMAAKNKRILADLRIPRLGVRFRSLAETVAARHPRAKKLSVRDALDLEMCAVHVILQETGIRNGNAARLDLHRHIVRPLVGADVPWLISIPKEEVKNEQAINLSLSLRASAIVADYLERARPLLLKAPRSALFISQNGVPKSPSALTRQYGCFTEREVGIRIHPHFHRHYCATTIVNTVEGGMRVASKILAHKSVETTATFYADLEAGIAQNRWHRILEGLRAEDAVVLETLTGRSFERRKAA